MVSAAVAVRVADDPEGHVFPTENLVGRIRPFVLPNTDPNTLFKTLLYILVRPIVDIRINVRFCVVLVQLLLVAPGSRIHQFVPPTTGPHEEHAKERIVEPVESDPEATPVSDPLEIRRVDEGVGVEMRLALGFAS